MGLQYGTNFSASQIARMLEKNDIQQTGVRTWSQLLGGASLGFGAQTDTLTSSYSDAMRQAYEQNFKQQEAINAAGLSQGYTDQALALNRQELAQTYDTYIRNYGKDISTAAENYGTEVGAIAGDLSARAENFEKLFSSTYDYLSGELYGSMKGEKNYLTEYGLDWLRATNTDGTTRLKSWEELTEELFDENGELTEQGIRFYDQMFNTSAGMVADYTSTKGERIRGFDEWLAATDADLREWWLSTDEYNYTLEGRNRGTANVLSGRESTDYDPNIPEQTVLTAIKDSSKLKKDFSRLNVDAFGANIVREKGEGDAWFGLRSLDQKKTWDELFESWEKTGAVFDDSARIEEFIQGYKKNAFDIENRVKKRIEAFLDTNLKDEFWKEYGKEIDTLMKEINDWEAPVVRGIRKEGSERLESAKALREKGKSLNEAYKRLFENIDTFLENKSKTPADRSQSGF